MTEYTADLRRVEAVEQAAIQTATEYVIVNGFDKNDKRAVGLVLAGMAIVARCSPEAREALATGYRGQHDNATAHTLEGWTNYLNEAAR